MEVRADMIGKFDRMERRVEAEANLTQPVGASELIFGFQRKLIVPPCSATSFATIAVDLHAHSKAPSKACTGVEGIQPEQHLQVPFQHPHES